MKARIFQCVTASCIITKSLPFVTNQTVWQSGKNSGSYDYCSWGYTFLSRNKCKGGALGTHPRWRPRSMSAPIGSVSPWGVYLYMSMIWSMCVVKMTKVVFLICRYFFYLQRVSFFGCVVSICSVCVVKMTKVVFLICRCFFYLQRVSFFGCVVSICSVCVVKLTKVVFLICRCFSYL